MLNFHYCPISIKFFSVLFILALLLTPIFVFADCGKAGTTVVFTNGIWGDEISAKNNLKQLNREYSKRGFLDDVTFVNSYNQTHMLGFMDVINSITQAYGASGADYDLTNILLNLHKDLNTQKVLLVGHSQGTFYTNAAYEYLIGHGVDKDSISVYNVATPADRVAGNGKYLTSSTDEVINTIVTNLAIIGGVNRPLPANIEIKIPKEPEVDYGRGHSFGTVYLGLASNRIIGDIDGQIAI